jgi:hypothetical protein
MLDEYSYLFLEMHKSELVLNSILEVSECELAVSECSENVFSPPVQGVPVKHLYFTMPEEFKQDLKEKMRLSLEFCRRFLNKNLSQENAGELEELIAKLESKSTNEENGCFDNSSKAPNGFTTLFKVCVFYDIINGQSSEEAKDHLLSEKGKVLKIDSIQKVSRIPLFK